MNEHENITIPYIVFESTSARSERTIKRLVISLVISVLLMFATNIFWIYAFCSFDYTSEETTVEADSGTANFIGEDGDITYGTYNGTKEKQEEKT